MRVNFEKEVFVESSVDISIDDVTDMLREQLSEIERRYDPDREHRELDDGRIRQLIGFMNSIHCCLSGITDDMVNSIEPKKRHLVFDALQKHADRWRTTAVPTTAMEE